MVWWFKALRATSAVGLEYVNKTEILRFKKKSKFSCISSNNYLL